MSLNFLYIITPCVFQNEGGETFDVENKVLNCFRKLKEDNKIRQESYYSYSNDQDTIQLTCLVDDSLLYNVRQYFYTETGVGHQYGSMSSMRPLSTQFPKTLPIKFRENNFLQKVTQSRIELIVEVTRVSAEFSFDYLILLISASVLAAMGLATDNAVVIVSSMLVSPIMGPVMACTLGTTLHNWPLVQLGLCTELISLLICIIIGAIYGVAQGFIGTNGDWPTYEMTSRGSIPGLYMGVVIAAFAGLAVAVSVLNSNTASLVGVAISASLLPPAVNSGLSAGYASVQYLWQPDRNDALKYSTEQYLHDTLMSFTLVLINIAGIFIFACLLFKVKEVVPVTDNMSMWSTAVSEVRDRGPPPDDIFRSDPYLQPVLTRLTTGNARLLRKIFRNHNRLSQSRPTGVKRNRSYNCLMDQSQQHNQPSTQTPTTSTDTNMRTQPTAIDPLAIITKNKRETSEELLEEAKTQFCKINSDDNENCTSSHGTRSSSPIYF